MSLFHPPKGFPPHLVVFWPLVWFQLRLLGAAVRAAYGANAIDRGSITPNGRVFPICIHFRPEDKAAREWPKPRTYASDRLAAACDGRAFTPAYAARCAAPHDADMALVVRRSMRVCILNLPLPET